MPKRIAPKGILKKGWFQPLKRVLKRVYPRAAKRVSLKPIYIGRKYFPAGYPGVYRDDTQWLSDKVTLRRRKAKRSVTPKQAHTCMVSSFLARCVIC
jgi:hypothetical protein